MSKFQNLTKEEVFYIAGFLDGDGSINAQIVRNEDYYFDHQIRVSVTFYQLGKRHWFLKKLQQWLNMGTLRKYVSDDRMCDLAIVAVEDVEQFLNFFGPHILIKQKQVKLALEVLAMKKLFKNKVLNTPEGSIKFIEMCKIVDQFEKLNDSKKRTITTETVKKAFRTKFNLDYS